MTKSKLERKEFISLALPYNSSSSGKLGQELKQRRNLEAAADVEAMEPCYLLAFSSWLAQTAFLQYPGLLVERWYHPQWAAPPPALMKKMSCRLALWKQCLH